MSALGGRLSSLTVKHARKPGMLADGNGLYLQVTRASARSWIFRYYRNGKSHEMGLGSLKAVSLAAARFKAAACRGLLADGTDPIAARDAERTQQALKTPGRLHSTSAPRPLLQRTAPPGKTRSMLRSGRRH